VGRAAKQMLSVTKFSADQARQKVARSPPLTIKASLATIRRIGLTPNPLLARVGAEVVSIIGFLADCDHHMATLPATDETRGHNVGLEGES
jgi:hypothetical protein